MKLNPNGLKQVSQGGCHGPRNPEKFPIERKADQLLKEGQVLMNLLAIFSDHDNWLWDPMKGVWSFVGQIPCDSPSIHVNDVINSLTTLGKELRGVPDCVFCRKHVVTRKS